MKLQEAATEIQNNLRALTYRVNVECIRMDKQAEYDARWLEALMMSIKGTRITNSYGDGGCGDENDTDVEEMTVVLMVTAAQDVAPGDDDDDVDDDEDVDNSNGGGDDDDNDDDEIDGGEDDVAIECNRSPDYGSWRWWRWWWWQRYADDDEVDGDEDDDGTDGDRRSGYELLMVTKMKIRMMVKVIMTTMMMIMLTMNLMMIMILITMVVIIETFVLGPT